MQGFNYNLPRGLVTWFQNFSDQIENDYSRHTNGVVLRSDSSPSSLGTVFGVKAQSRFNRKDAWHSLAIKPDKMRECGRRKTEKKGGHKKPKRRDWKNLGKTKVRGDPELGRTKSHEGQGRLKNWGNREKGRLGMKKKLRGEKSRGTTQRRGAAPPSSLSLHLRTEGKKI